MKTVTASILVSEVNGKLDIVASIPDNAEGSIAAAITTEMLKYGKSIMDIVLKANTPIFESKRQS